MISHGSYSPDIPVLLNLVYSQWFIDRDTRVIENQPHHLIPLYSYERKRPYVSAEFRHLYFSNAEAFKRI
eukprot:SAG31_NODE_13597_length_858_cov_2.375494_2_plen_70_part_00